MTPGEGAGASDWLAEVRAEFAANEQVRMTFRNGLESGDLTSLQAADWPYPLTPRPLPKTIWMYWAQGWAEAPDIVLRCRETWARLNPGWRLVALDDASLPDHVDMREMFTDRPMRIAASADILRLNLLHRHGGVWADATTVCALPLDGWLPVLMQSGFFAFARPRPDRAIATWFLASEPDGVVMGRWRDLVRRYWRETEEADHYFWAHYLFAHGCRTDRTMGAGWAATPQVSAHGALQAQVLNFVPEALSDVLSSVAAGVTPVFKMNRRIPYSDDGSPVSQLFQALMERTSAEASPGMG